MMNEIIEQLRLSIADDILSKTEKVNLKTLLPPKGLQHDQLALLQEKIFELANQKISESNYRFILEWVRNASATLTSSVVEKSEVFFSPGESCRQAIIQQITLATRRISICVFTISDNQIADAIIAAKRKGIDIRVITDNDKSFDLGSDIGRMAREGVVVKMDNTTDHMHHKFMIVDDERVLTGSYNWTQSAARVNHENILLVSTENVVKSFQTEFDKLWDLMKIYVNTNSNFPNRV